LERDPGRNFFFVWLVSQRIEKCFNEIANRKSPNTPRPQGALALTAKAQKFPKLLIINDLQQAARGVYAISA